MSNYVKSTNFTAKDSLPTGDANKVVRGSEFDTEFNAIQTAVGTKADLAGPTFTGTATFANLTATGTVNLSGATVSDLGSITTVDINGGTIDAAVIGGATPAAGSFTAVVGTTGTFSGAVSGTTGTFSGAVSGTTGTFSGAVTGSNLNVSNWDTAFGWGNHASAGYLTSVDFSDISAGAITTSSETFTNSNTQIPTNAAVVSYVAATIPTISEVNDLTSSVTWANVPDANITQSSVTQHQAALAIAATQLTGNITVPGNVYLAPSGTGFTELRGNTNAGAIRFNCESNSHGVTLKGPPHSAAATYSLELPNADGSAGQFLKTDGSGKLSFDTVSVNNITGDVTITGELLADSYNEKFKRVSTVGATSGYQLGSAAYDSASLSYSSLSNNASNTIFNNNGTKLYVLIGQTRVAHQFSLSTAYDLSTASSDSVSFDFSSQDTGMSGLAFNGDGTKIYACGYTNDNVYQYSLSTAYNLSSISYDSVSLSVSSQDSLPGKIQFNSDGTSLYVFGSNNNSVFQYTLTSAYNLSTASYASKSFSVASQTTSGAGFVLNNNGTKLFVVETSSDKIYQYSLSTAFDISTASYDSVSFSVTSQAPHPVSITFNSDGTKLFVTDNTNSALYQYSTTATTYSTTFDCEDANVFDTILSANTTVVFSNPPAAGSATDSTAYGMSLKVIQDSGASGYTVTWPTSVKWPAATAPTLTATASAVDQFVFYTKDGGTNWYGFTAGQALA